MYRAVFWVDYREDALFCYTAKSLNAKIKFLRDGDYGHQYEVIGDEYALKQLIEQWYPDEIEEIE